MKKGISFVTSLVLCLTFVSGVAYSQVVVIVDDVPGNDAAYVNGTGGNFSGASAVKDAVNAVNADPTAGNYEIRIIDTNGSADTYVGDFLLLKANTTIHQVANGGGNDVGVTLQGDGTSPSHPTSCFLLQADNCTLSGLSPSKPMTVTRADPAARIITGCVASNLTWQNLNYTGDGDLDHNDWATTATGQHFVNCTFRVGNGPQFFGTTTVLDNCVCAGGGFKAVHLGTCNVTWNNCDLTATSAGGLHLGGDGCNVTFNDCSFRTNTAGFGARLVWNAVLGNGANITFNRPTFAGQCGDVVFDIQDINANITVAGTPTNKVNFDTIINAGTALLARIANGSLTFIDCTRSVGGPNTLDCIGTAGLAGNVKINLDRCIFRNANSNMDFVDCDPNNPVVTAYSVVLNATNCIWVGASTAAGQIMHTRGARTGASTFKFTHCTIQGPTVNIFWGGNANANLSQTGLTRDTLICNYCILDDRNMPACSGDFGAGNGTLQGVGNLMTKGGTVCGGFCVGVPAGFDTVVTGDPFIDADGKLTAGSLALGGAVGSTMNLDNEGDVRPQGNTSPDIGADESALQGPVLGWPMKAAKISGSNPTIDGNINVGTEYSGAYVVDMRLSTLTAADPFTAGVTHNGTYLPVNGTITNDADASGLYYLLWNTSGLYIAADVSDENLSPSSGATPNAGDAFQICLDYDQTNAPDAQVAGAKVYIPTYRAIAGSGTAPVANTADFHAFWPTSSPNPMTGTQWATTTHAAGFRTETFIPWTAFTAGGDTFTNPFPPANGQTCGALMMIDDHDGGAGQGISFMYTSGGGANIIVNAGQYNDIVFEGQLEIEDWAQY